MQIHIREAVISDCPRLIELIKELALYEKAPDEVTVTLAHFQEAGFGAAPVWKAIVAEVDHLVVGFALYYTRFSTWKGCRLYLEDFLVTDAFRGKGIGKVLFESVLKIANQEQYHGMSWQVLDWNEPAINFYKKYEAGLDPEWLNGSLSQEQLKAWQ